MRQSWYYEETTTYYRKPNSDPDPDTGAGCLGMIVFLFIFCCMIASCAK